MAFINDEILEGGLDYADTNGTQIDICSQEPTTRTEAVTTYTLGNDTVNTGAPQDAATGTGRRVVVPAISDGSVTGTGTASHWALTSATELLATGDLTGGGQSVTSGNKFTLDAIDIIIRDPV